MDTYEKSLSFHTQILLQIVVLGQFQQSKLVSLFTYNTECTLEENVHSFSSGHR